MIDISVVKAAIPKVESELLQPEYAADLLDCNIESGSLAPVKGDLLLPDPIQADTETVYHTGDQLYQWPGLVDVARSFDDIDSKRILFTGSGYPKETDTALGDTGGGPWPSATRRNGLPTPEDAPGILLGGTAGEEADERGRYSWVYTYYFERPDGSVIESAPSPPSGIITLMDGETATMDLMAYPSPAVEGCSYTGVRIYRIQATENSALYHFVHEQASVSDWLDNVTDLEASANVILETMDMSTGSPVSWDRPIDNLNGITKVDSGFFVGYSGNKIYPSVIFVPYAFPGKYSLSADSKIKGIGCAGSVVVALTEDAPYLLIGQDPATVSFRSLNYSRPCIGENRSIVSTPGGVMFPSNEGFFLISPTGTETSLTENIFTVDQWEALNPASFISFLYRGKLVAMEAGTKNIHIIDFRRGRYERAQAEEIIRAAYQKKEDGTIYLVQDSADGRELRQWRGGEDKPLYWESKIFTQGTQAFYSRALVRGVFTGGKTATITLNVDGVDRPPITVAKPGMVNTGRIRGNEVIVKISGTAKIKRFRLGGSAREVLNV